MVSAALQRGAHSRRLAQGAGTGGRYARWRRWAIGYLFIIPAVLFAAVFAYYPAASAIVHAFFSWNGFTPARFTGVRNFAHMVRDPVLRGAVVNMLQYVAGSVLLVLTVPLVVARLVVAVRGRLARTGFRLLFVLPMLIPAYVLALVWTFFYDPNIGLVDRILGNVGLGRLRHAWLADPHTALYAIIFLGIPWISIPFTDGLAFLLYTAALEKIPREVTEAAALDGCGPLRRFFRVEVPFLKGQLRLLTIITVVSAVSVFTTILIMTNGGPGNATMVPGVVIFDAAFQQSEFGYASAIALVLFVALLVFTGLLLRWKRLKPDVL